MKKYIKPQTLTVELNVADSMLEVTSLPMGEKTTSGQNALSRRRRESAWDEEEEF